MTDEQAILQRAFNTTLARFRADLASLAVIAENLAASVAELTSLIDRIAQTDTVAALGMGVALDNRESNRNADGN